MKNRKIVFYILLLTFYLVCIFLLTGIGAMILGFADYPIIINFGIINILIADIYFKIKSLEGLILGFLISGVGLISSYLFWFLISNFQFSLDLIILPMVVNAITQTVCWKIVEAKWIKINNYRVLGIAVFTSIVLFLSFNISDYWIYEKYYNGKNKTSFKIKIVDTNNEESIVGDTIELRTKKQPLYGIMRFPLLSKQTTDLNGIAIFEVYKGNTYRGSIRKKDGSSDFFIVESEDIKENKTLEIKTTANNGYK